MMQYFDDKAIGDQFSVENDDGTYNFCVKISDHTYVVLKNKETEIEFGSPYMLVMQSWA